MLVVPGLIVVVCGIALRVWGHGHADRTARIVSAVVGLVAMVAGMGLRTRRRLRALRPAGRVAAPPASDPAEAVAAPHPAA